MVGISSIVIHSEDNHLQISEQLFTVLVNALRSLGLGPDFVGFNQFYEHSTALQSI